jgi:ADP-L-glycero-D-manno-heptose 6-epimerase
MASMVWQLANQVKSNQRPRIFKWGEQKRDQVYIKDVVRANLLALKAKKNAIVNIGSGQTISFNEIIEVLNKIFSLNLEPQYIENPYVGSYQEYTQADLTLANSVLGYTPIWKFDEAVKDYMQMVGFKDS